METESTIFDQIKSTTQSYLPEADVILFGSRARGDSKFNSDYDLLIIVSTDPDNSLRLHTQSMIRKALASQHILADVILYSKSEIESKSKLPGHFLRSALNEGILV